MIEVYLTMVLNLDWNKTMKQLEYLAGTKKKASVFQNQFILKYKRYKVSIQFINVINES